MNPTDNPTITLRTHGMTYTISGFPCTVIVRAGHNSTKVVNTSNTAICASSGDVRQVLEFTDSMSFNGSSVTAIYFHKSKKDACTEEYHDRRVSYGPRIAPLPSRFGWEGTFTRDGVTTVITPRTFAYKIESTEKSCFCMTDLAGEYMGFSTCLDIDTFDKIYAIHKSRKERNSETEPTHFVDPIRPANLPKS